MNDHDTDTVGHFDAHDCMNLYDTEAAVLGIWAAAHPTAPGGAAAALALGTHLYGDYVCNGGTFDVPPAPSYLDGKLGYDPAHESAPSFTAPSLLPDSPTFDMGTTSASGGSHDVALFADQASSVVGTFDAGATSPYTAGSSQDDGASASAGSAATDSGGV